MTTGTPRVLIVDDERVVRELTERLARRLGWETEGAASAEEARKKLSSTARPSALLVDRSLPDADGLTLLRELCRDYGLPGAIISGHPDPGNAGVPWLQKPYRVEQLGDLLRDLQGIARTP